MSFVSSIKHETTFAYLCRPNHPPGAPALILPSPLPKPPKLAKQAQTGTQPPSTPRKRPLDQDGADGAPPPKRRRASDVPAVNLASPSKKRRLDEDGLLILENPNEKIEEGDVTDVITIED